MRPLCDIHSMDHRRLFASSLMLWRLVVWASLAGIVLSLATPSTQGLATGNEPLPTRSMNFLPELDLSSRSIDATNLTQLPLCAVSNAASFNNRSTTPTNHMLDTVPLSNGPTNTHSPPLVQLYCGILPRDRHGLLLRLSV